MSEHTPTQPRTRFFSLRWKLLIGFTVLFSLVFAAAFYWFYSYSTNEALRRIQQDLEDTIKGAAAEINGSDLVAVAQEAWQKAAPFYADGELSEEEFNQSIALLNEYKQDPRLANILKWLDQVHKVEPRAYPYLAVPADEPDTIIYAADWYMINQPEETAPFMYKTKPNYIQSLEALKEEKLIPRLTNGQFDVYEDEWGRWVSAYYSVKDNQGNIVGLIGIDFVADYVNEVRQGILNSVVGAFAIVYSILFILVFLVSNTFTRPMAKLTDAARAIGEGNYEQDLSQLTGGKVRDEINTLAHVFTIMVGKVYQREQTLRRQVEELKIEIDEVKRSKQLSEIVDTDFFRELQVKAKVMRQRSRGSQADEQDTTTPSEE